MSDTFITDVATPICVFALMFCVGFELRREDLRSVILRPRSLIIGSLIQALTAPILAFVIVLALEPSPEMTWAIVMLAISPGGALSNAYCYLAGLNVGLSVSLTIVGSLISILSFPVLGELLLGSLSILGIETVTFPRVVVFLQLFVFVLIPVVFGMLFRILLREDRPYMRLVFRRMGLALLVVVVGMAVVATSANLIEVIQAGWIPATAFTGGTIIAAFTLGRLLDAEDTFVISIEASVRNVPIALLVSTQALEASSMIGFFLCYLLVQFVMLLTLVYFLGNNVRAKI